ncbi:MAG TPA: ribosome maturation factor RimM [Jiangellaceae bacterium]|nr:ribosome maturation factor RimM [Jiangellaceae bacterium]
MLVTVGRIGRAHGIRGEVSVDVRTDSPELRFADGARLTTEPVGAGPLVVGHTRWHSGRLLVRFDGVSDRAVAEGLRGVRLLAEAAEDERLDDPEEFFDHQLVGLHAVTTAGDAVGDITEVLHLPGQDLLVVRRPDNRETLVPFVADIVPEVDLAAARVVLDPPVGLLEDEATP